LLLHPQVGVFSATLPPEALEITRKFMNKPVSVKFTLACLNFTVGTATRLVATHVA
jgi:superfamily II DNA/RNA helicase